MYVKRTFFLHHQKLQALFCHKIIKNSYPTLAILLVLSKTAIKTGLLL